MSALLQHLENGESAWRLPTEPRQSKELHASVDDATPAANMPWRDASHMCVERWHNTQGATSERNQEFMALLDACRDSGGLARTHELMGMFKRGDGGDTAQLARWIVTRQVISIAWQDQTWFPWFQFDRGLGRPQSVVGQIASELCLSFDDWEIASWFVRPHPYLDNATPAETLTRQPADLLGAARASRGLAKS